jgi:hypothetical protein
VSYTKTSNKKNTQLKLCLLFRPIKAIHLQRVNLYTPESTTKSYKESLTGKKTKKTNKFPNLKPLENHLYKIKKYEESTIKISMPNKIDMIQTYHPSYTTPLITPEGAYPYDSDP